MLSNQLIPVFPKTKQHFQILDGLRGVAAISVVIFHFMESAVPDYHKNFIAHSYMAVDFFFCLSGFVLAYAYDSKIKTIGLVHFFRLRLIRLYPLVIIGSILGLLVFIFDPFSKLYETYGRGQTLLLFLTSCLLSPYPIMSQRYFSLFSLNPPMWSLFWEFIANALYAFILIKLPRKILWVLVLIAGAALCFESFRLNNLGGGWSAGTFSTGGIRMLFSFMAGILVYRSNWIIKSQLGFAAMTILLTLAFLFPFSDKLNSITDAVFVILYFPFLIALGAGSTSSGVVNKICNFLGEISYPLYMLHYTFIWIFAGYLKTHKPNTVQLTFIITIGTLLLIGFAYVVMVFIDVPIRRYFTNKLKTRAAAGNSYSKTPRIGCELKYHFVRKT